MAVRPIDGNVLIKWFRPYLHTGEAIPADVVIENIRSMPTLTPPNEPLIQADLDSMDYDKVWIDYEDDTGEWALVCNGYIYSIDALEGAGLDFVDYMRGERLEPHGYKVYRFQSEGETNA